MDAEPVTRVEIVEVGPRDGLQNESRVLPTETKLELVDRACAAGLRRIEVTSFVHPARVPQMADAEAVAAGLPAYPGVELSALVLNKRGYDRALAAGIRSVNTFVATTDSFSTRNQGMTIAETLAVVATLRARAGSDGIALAVTIGTAFGCPFEGEVPATALATVLTRVAALEPGEIALADTIGVAVPSDVEERLALAGEIAPAATLRLHFHNTRNTGIANAIAAVRAGARVLDASLAGIGGCPFAPAATGNIATEDLVYALERMGYDTGVSLQQAVETARWIADELGIEPPGMVARAGGFPS